MNKSIFYIVTVIAFFGSIGQLLLKLGSNNLEYNIISFLTNWKIILGLSIYALTSIAYIYALKYENLSTIFPIISTSYVWVVLFSIFFLNESFPTYKWLGLGLLLSGLIIIVR